MTSIKKSFILELISELCWWFNQEYFKTHMVYFLIDANFCYVRVTLIFSNRFEEFCDYFDWWLTRKFANFGID